MRVEPAHIEQIQQAADGRWVQISAEASAVAADLEKIDAGLKVRFVEVDPPYWAIYHESHPGCPHNAIGGEHGAYLVTTQQAHPTRSGVWTGLDDRLVEEIRYIDPEGRSHYNYADALERNRQAKERRRRAAFQERMGEAAEEAAHALRRDLYLGPLKGRIFVPRDIG